MVILVVLVVKFATLKRQTEEKLKQIARTAEKIKNASQQKIRMVTCRAEIAENELCSAKEKIFNMESELILLRDDSTNLRYLLKWWDSNVIPRFCKTLEYSKTF